MMRSSNEACCAGHTSDTGVCCVVGVIQRHAYRWDEWRRSLGRGEGASLAIFMGPHGCSCMVLVPCSCQMRTCLVCCQLILQPLNLSPQRPLISLGVLIDNGLQLHT